MELQSIHTFIDLLDTNKISKEVLPEGSSKLNGLVGRDAEVINLSLDDTDCFSLSALYIENSFDNYSNENRKKFIVEKIIEEDIAEIKIVS